MKTKSEKPLIPLKQLSKNENYQQINLFLIFNQLTSICLIE